MALLSFTLLEKLKAGLGAAGLGAVGADVIVSRFAAGPATVTAVTVAVAIAGFIAASYVTEVSPGEARLVHRAKRDEVLDLNG